MLMNKSCNNYTTDSGNPEMNYTGHNCKDNRYHLLFVCRVGMWETPSVFHISMRFSFFATFFLFARPPFFVD